VNVQVIEREVSPVASHDPVEAQGEVAPERLVTLRADAAGERKGAFSGTGENRR
jgi:hypothetical protein